MNQDHLLKLYQTIFETWRSQVDSYWQRSAYFAAFETAAIAGCWHLLNNDHKIWAGALLAVSGAALTFAWIYNNHKVHGYVLHWWTSLRKIEEKLLLNNEGVDFVRQQEGGGCIPYRYLVQAVPAIFLLAWLVLFVWSVLLWCGCVNRPS